MDQEVICVHKVPLWERFSSMQELAQLIEHLRIAESLSFLNGNFLKIDIFLFPTENLVVKVLSKLVEWSYILSSCALYDGSPHPTSTYCLFSKFTTNNIHPVRFYDK